MDGEPYTVVGRLVRTHGLLGELSFMAFADADPALLVGIDVWITPPPSGGGSSRIESVRTGPKGPLITLQSFASIDVARPLAGRELLARTADLPDAWRLQPADDSMVGVTVSDELHGELGQIVEVIETGANDVWVVHGPLGEVLIPVIDDVVLDVDCETGAARVRLLPGLLPSEGESA